MNTEEWGVTERGFHRPTYVELLDALEYKARELFGIRPGDSLILLADEKRGLAIPPKAAFDQLAAAVFDQPGRDGE